MIKHITHGNAHPFSVSVDQGRQGDDIAKRTTGGGKPVHSIHNKVIHIHFAGSTFSNPNGIIDIYNPLLKYGTGVAATPGSL